MRTTLPRKSRDIKERLDHVVRTILAIGKDKVAMIILYGSYARGDWVSDVSNGYQSDLDILVVLNKARYMAYEATKLQSAMKKKLLLRHELDMMTKPIVLIIVEPITRINEEIEKGRSFYCDVRKDGVLLYDSGEFTLSKARKLRWSKRKPIAQEDYEYWFKRGISFSINCDHALEREDFEISAFELHQATENFYHTILLVFDGYQPKLHDIEELNIKARKHSNELYKIFPRATPEQDELFKLLKDAYVRARYDKTYKISKEQLLYLIERVEIKAVTEEICLKKLNS